MSRVSQGLLDIYRDSSRFRFLRARLLSDEDDSEPLLEEDEARAARCAASYKAWPMSSSN